MPRYLVTTSQTVYWEYEVDAESAAEATEQVSGWRANGIPDDVVHRDAGGGGDEEVFKVRPISYSGSITCEHGTQTEVEPLETADVQILHEL